MSSFLLLLASLLLSYLDLAAAYCAGIGSNPGFSGPPSVQQVDLATVRVSWRGLATRVDCADDFLVKWWPVSDPYNYKMTDFLPTDTYQQDVLVVPRVEHEFQVIAREEKGWKGVDYNKSKTVRFATSAAKKRSAASSSSSSDDRDSASPPPQPPVNSDGSDNSSLTYIVVGSVLGVCAVMLAVKLVLSCRHAFCDASQA